MPGNNISLTLPSLSDTLTTIVSKVNTALTAIQTDIAPKVSASQINVNGQLDFQGNTAANVGTIVLSGGASTAVGSLYYFGGELYTTTSAGAVKITSAGSVNVASLGGISGDPSAVTYNAGAGEFRFQDSALAYQTLVGKSLKLSPTAGGPLTVTVDAALGGRTLNVKSLPASGISLLAYDASTSSLVDAATVTAGNATAVSALTATTISASTSISTASLTTSSDYKHTDDWTYPFWPSSIWSNNNGVIALSPTPGTAAMILITGSCYLIGTSPILGVRVGDRIKTFTMRWTHSLSVTVNLVRYNIVTGSSSVVQSYADATTGAHTTTVTVSSPYTTTANDIYYITTNSGTPFASGDAVTGIYYTVDHP